MGNESRAGVTVRSAGITDNAKSHDSGFGVRERDVLWQEIKSRWRYVAMITLKVFSDTHLSTQGILLMLIAWYS